MKKKLEKIKIQIKSQHISHHNRKQHSGKRESINSNMPKSRLNRKKEKEKQESNIEKTPGQENPKNQRTFT